MRLQWDSLETMTIPNVGTVRPGCLFEIEDSRGEDLIQRGLASRLEPKSELKLDQMVPGRKTEHKRIDAITKTEE